ncbi:cytochrome P450 [Streptomyces albofaciens JCM 4342]|uniref:cytochrome P450 n=1 Tax=Streptomyces albofaciens TaxID=66866 RepID=UPI00123C457B|nr:cytochrome P450 [Streptomyces albofaciens]KAA6212017.1 cytochrome P450 [Streptomyces albofaciens JCM 4342]
MTGLGRAPVAPGAVPVLGHARQLLRQPLAFVSSLPAQGRLVEIRVGTAAVLVVCGPGEVRHMLLDDRAFDRGGLLFDRARVVLGEGLGTCPRAAHRRRRRLAQPAFRARRMADYARVMTDQITRVTQAWQEGRELDVLAQTQEVAARTVVAVMVSACEEDTALGLIEDCNVVSRGIFRRLFLPPVLGGLPLPGNRRYRAARQRIAVAMARMISDYRTGGDDRGVLLSALLAAGDADSEGLSDLEITDELKVFFFAGMETTAAALAWALYLVSRHPSAMRRLEAEVDEVLEGRPAAFEDLPRLVFTGQVLAETLRLYPPAWLTTRVAMADTVLAGCHVPAGITLAYSPYLMHRLPELHDEPQRFLPERWANGFDWRRAPGMLPFGAGAHQCIGDGFAVTEATLALATITARWRLEAVPGRTVRPAPSSVLNPNGLYLKPLARTSAGRQAAS